MLAMLHFVWRVAIPVLATDALHDDWRQNFFWLTQVRAGVDFAGTDPLTRYARDFQPPVLAWAYEQLARVVDPERLAKLVGLALIPGFAVALWRLGEHVSPRSAFAPLLVTLGFLDVAWIREMAGGLSRSFAPPLQIGVVACVAAECWWAAAALVALGGLLHPQSMLLGATVLLVGWLRAARRAPRARTRLALLRAAAPVATAALVAGVLALVDVEHARAVQGRFGPFLSRAEILESIDYGPGGRFRNEHPQNLVIEAARTLALHLGVPEEVLVRVPPFAPAGPQLAWALGFLGATGIVLEALRRGSRARWRDVPWFVPACVAIAAAWNVAAWLLLPRLYFPRRFLGTLVPLAAFGTIAWLADRALARIATSPSPVPRRAALATLILLAALASVRFGGERAGYRIERSGYAGVAKFLAAQPLAMRYAASPRGDADTLIALVPRRIFVASEISHPLFREYLERTVRPRTRLVTRALFPEDPFGDLGALRAAGVDLLVARRRDLGWTELPASFAYEPIRSEVSAYWDREHRAARDALWASFTPATIAYQDEAFVVFDLRRVDFRSRPSGEPRP
ncbi:MAG: hypothetical protein U0610_32435 [bacterium]